DIARSSRGEEDRVASGVGDQVTPDVLEGDGRTGGTRDSLYALRATGPRRSSGAGSTRGAAPARGSGRSGRTLLREQRPGCPRRRRIASVAAGKTNVARPIEKHGITGSVGDANKPSALERNRGPAGPIGPVAPVRPMTPCEPVEPAGPATPVEPVGPVRPVGPLGPAR